ncbi:MAG: hypothetical protein OEX02_21100 [Cyclobacteriaceae bacterium]|nr:hypothetical protein [Cyclobacteriaceae bacterium]
MKTGIKIMLAIVFSFYLNSVFSQVAIIDYMKLKSPGTEADYLALEKEWRPIHEAKVKSGVLLGWYLYQVRFSGANSPYQYVVISIYKDFEATESIFPQSLYDIVLKGKDQDEFQQRTLAVRDLTHSEVFTRIDGLNTVYSKPSKYLYLHFMYVEQHEADNYIETEKYIWKPMHTDLQRRGILADWSLWDLWFNTHADYRFVTFNSFHNYAEIASYSYSDVFQTVHQGRDLSEVMQHTWEARKSVKRELWELIDYVSSDE